MKKESRSNKNESLRPAMTPDARESQMIALAEQLAERQLREGTASAQVITHYLKLATARERTEREILEKQKELIVAKTENLKSNKNIEELYTQAMAAFKDYSGQNREDEYADFADY